MLQQTLGFEDELDRIASCAVAAPVRGHVMRLGFHLLPRIGHGYGQAARAHHRQVDHVIAHVSNLVEGDAFLRHNLAYRLHLEGLALIDEFELQIAGAQCHSLADPLGNNAQLHAAQPRQRNACAVVGAITLGLDHLAGNGAIGPGDWNRNDPDISVGQDAIDVEENDFDAPGAILCGKSHTPDFTESKGRASLGRGSRVSHPPRIFVFKRCTVQIIASAWRKLAGSGGE